MALATLSIDLEARLAKLQTGFDRAVHISDKSTRDMTVSFDRLDKKIGDTAKSLAALFTVREFQQLVVGFGRTAQEITTLSQVSGTSAEQFQRMAYGTQQLGIAQDKLADIFKDTQDKVGEFLQTGGGPLKDFFEGIAPKIGITAEQFRNLSGPQALQLYFDGLQKANLSQKSMTFYMEALASDSAKLIPLLRDNGAAWQRMGDEAERVGAVISDVDIRVGVEFDRNVQRLSASLKALGNAIAVSAVPALSDMIDQFVEGQREAGGFWNAIRLFGTQNPFKSAAESVTDLREEIADLEADIARFKTFGAPTDSLETALATVRKRFEFAKLLQRQQALQSAGDVYSNEGRTASDSGLEITPAGKPSKKGAGKKREFDELTAAGKAYEDAVLAIARAEDAADKATRTLNGAQSALLDVLKSPEWSQMPAAWQQVVLSEAQAATEAIRVADETKRLNDLLDATPTANLEKLRDTMQLLERAFLANKISADQFNEAALTALGAIPEKAKQAEDAMTVFAEQAARNMQDAFAEFLFDPFDAGTKGMLASFEMTLRKMAAQQISAQIFKGIGSWGSTGGGAGSFLGNIAASIFGGGKAAGGDVMPWTDYKVGENGPEVVRIGATGGTVVPNHKLRGDSISVTNHFVLEAPADRRTQEQIAALAGTSIRNAMRRSG